MEGESMKAAIRANFTIPGDILDEFNSIIPKRQKSKVISQLLKEEVERRKRELYKIAREVENDEKLNQEMKDWETTIGDGLDDV